MNAVLEDDEHVSEEDVEQSEEDEWLISDELWALRKSRDVVERVARRVKDGWHGLEIDGDDSESLEITRSEKKLL